MLGSSTRPACQSWLNKNWLHTYSDKDSLLAIFKQLHHVCDVIERISVRDAASRVQDAGEGCFDMSLSMDSAFMLEKQARGGGVAATKQVWV